MRDYLYWKGIKTLKLFYIPCQKRSRYILQTLVSTSQKYDEELCSHSKAEIQLHRKTQLELKDNNTVTLIYGLPNNSQQWETQDTFPFQKTPTKKWWPRNRQHNTTAIHPPDTRKTHRHNLFLHYFEIPFQCDIGRKTLLICLNDKKKVLRFLIGIWNVKRNYQYPRWTCCC